MFSIFNIIRNRRIYFLLSLVFIIPGVLAMVYNTITLPTNTPWRLSVDFKEGSRFELKFTGPITEDQIRQTFQTVGGINNPAVTRIGAEADNTWQVRSEFLEGEKAQEVRTALAKVAPLDETFTKADSVSATVASQTTRTAFFAVIAASLAILVFIFLAFRKANNPWRYAVCAIVALAHDVLVAAGLMAIFSIVLGWEIDALFLTAMLTVIGFSVQDTIVVYDRIRENLVRYKGDTFETIVTRSMVETLHRSLTISLLNILVMVALLLFGGASIKQFVAVLLIGLVSGTYSSIFNAVPLVVAWQERDFWGTRAGTAAALPAK
jgi:preprotein translocase SecF subunit